MTAIVRVFKVKEPRENRQELYGVMPLDLPFLIFLHMCSHAGSLAKIQCSTRLIEIHN